VRAPALLLLAVSLFAQESPRELKERSDREWIVIRTNEFVKQTEKVNKAWDRLAEIWNKNVRGPEYDKKAQDEAFGEYMKAVEELKKKYERVK
jgi:hypothetical protein